MNIKLMTAEEAKERSTKSGDILPLDLIRRIEDGIDRGINRVEWYPKRWISEYELDVISERLESLGYSVRKDDSISKIWVQAQTGLIIYF